MRTGREIKDFIQKYQPVHQAIMDMFTRVNMPPQDGEDLLMFIAGAPKGLRSVSVIGAEAQEMYIRGWQFGAEGE